MVLAVFLMEVRTDTTKCANKRIAGFRKCWDLVRAQMFIKDTAKVTSGAVVYIMKRRGPRTEPCGTPYEEVCEEERVLPHLTRNERDERYDEKKTSWWQCHGTGSQNKTIDVWEGWCDHIVTIANAQYQQIDNSLNYYIVSYFICCTLNSIA